MSRRGEQLAEGAGNVATADSRMAFANRKDAVKYLTRAANNFCEASVLTDDREDAAKDLKLARDVLARALDIIDEHLESP